MIMITIIDEILRITIIDEILYSLSQHNNAGLYGDNDRYKLINDQSIFVVFELDMKSRLSRDVVLN